MQTRIDSASRADPRIAEAEAILRSCVHCGFCNATCPTYQLLGSEPDGPRGRIYLVKNMLEEGVAGERTRLHLDRCLTCRSCETTCPSGVKYARLIDIGRAIVDERVRRPFLDRARRFAMLAVLPHPDRLNLALKFARIAKPFLPFHLKRKIFPRRLVAAFPPVRHKRKMLVLEGCVQPLASPNTNLAASRVLGRVGISLIPVSGCCGAMHQHMGKEEAARAVMRRNIDLWWPHVEAGIEAIALSASGCGLAVREYGQMLKEDERYAEKAEKVSSLVRDFSEILMKEDMSPFSGIGKGKRVAWHCPCTLQHGQKLGGAVESILKACGFDLSPVPDSHLCCGAAGTYSLLQPGISEKLLENKLAALQGGMPEIIATANVGCQMHLESGARLPVRHWIELFDQT